MAIIIKLWSTTLLAVLWNQQPILSPFSTNFLWFTHTSYSNGSNSKFIVFQKFIWHVGFLWNWIWFLLMQVFSSWMHFCAVRVFTESILRYGLPPSYLVLIMPLLQLSVQLLHYTFSLSMRIPLMNHLSHSLSQSVVLSPPAKSEKKVRSILEGMCSNSNRYYLEFPFSSSYILCNFCSSFFFFGCFFFWTKYPKFVTKLDYYSN